MLKWNELKNLIDEKLEQNGKDGNIDISYIDIGLHETVDTIDIYIEEGTLQVF